MKIKDHHYMQLIYYDDHDKRYSDLSPEEREEYPDEIKHIGEPLIKRIKNFREMTDEDWDKYGTGFVHLAAKDIPISQAMGYWDWYG